MWLGWQLYGYGVTGTYHPANKHYRHHPTGPNDPAVVAVSKQLHQPVLELVDLDAGIAQACQLDGRLRANPQHGPGGKGEQVDACGGDVLSELTGSNVVALLSEWCEQFLMDQVYLPEVRLRRVSSPCQIAVLDQLAGVRVAFYSHARNECDRCKVRLTERVSWAGADRHDELRSWPGHATHKQTLWAGVELLLHQLHRESDLGRFEQGR